MQIKSSLALRIIYCLAVFCAVFPFPLSGWARLIMGPSSTVPYIGPILLIILGAYRIFYVLKNRDTLNSYEPDAFPFAMRMFGLLAMVLGAIAVVAWPFSYYISLAIFGELSHASIEFELCVAMARGLAPLGIVLFEASRLIGFEAAKQVSVPDKKIQNNGL
jgi:putative Mn2+ efflux pump MntP